MWRRPAISQRSQKNKCTRYLCLVKVLFVLIYPHAFAYANNLDSLKIIDFKADTLLFNNGTKVGVYQGHVKLTQGSRILTAEYATSYTNRTGAIVKIIAIGHPAKCRILVSQKQPVLIATGSTIYYYPLQDYLEAVGDACIVQGHNHFQGVRLHYDFKKKTVGSPSSMQGHTRILLAPL